MPHLLQFAKNLPSGPSRRSILHQLGFQWLLVSGEADRILPWFWAFSLGNSMQKCTDLHLSCALIQLHYTMGFDWGQIAPTSSISFTCAQTSSTMGGGILQNLLSWRARHQQLWSRVSLGLYSPTLHVSKEKMSWYSANRAWVASLIFVRPPLHAR